MLKYEGRELAAGISRALGFDLEGVLNWFIRGEAAGDDPSENEVSGDSTSF